MPRGIAPVSNEKEPPRITGSARRMCVRERSVRTRKSIGRMGYRGRQCRVTVAVMLPHEGRNGEPGAITCRSV